jgi:predicted GNAT family acetyltransferase
MAATIGISHSESDSKGRYVARVEGRDGEGELTYSRISPTKVIADHTGVDENLRGTGVGAALVDRLVADARAQGLTIVPQCPFIRVLYKRHPEWSDVMEG